MNQIFYFIDTSIGTSCGGSGVLRIIKFIWDLLDILHFIIPIGLIVIVTMDIAKNVIASKEDDMKKNFSLAMKRVLFAVALFLVPTIVEFCVELLGGDLVGLHFMKCVDIALKEENLSKYDVFTDEDDYSDVETPNFNKKPSYEVTGDDSSSSTSPNDVTVEKLLEAAKKRADYVRENNFTYGDAPINPAINHDAKKVSCDRFVAWVLYDVGFKDQPEKQGIVVKSADPEHDFTSWCEKHGFKKITNINDVKAGDIIFQGMNGSPHVFLLGNKKDGDRWERYDGGSNNRIRSVQPFVEPINSTNTFSYAYRIVN